MKGFRFFLCFLTFFLHLDNLINYIIFAPVNISIICARPWVSPRCNMTPPIPPFHNAVPNHWIKYFSEQHKTPGWCCHCFVPVHFLCAVNWSVILFPYCFVIMRVHLHLSPWQLQLVLYVAWLQVLRDIYFLLQNWDGSIICFFLHLSSDDLSLAVWSAFNIAVFKNEHILTFSGFGYM